jgi:hypothetical protein
VEERTETVTDKPKNILEQIEAEVASLTDEDIREALRRIQEEAHRRRTIKGRCTGFGTSHTFIISHDEYMGQEPGMRSFSGTYRELLRELVDLDLDDPMTDGEAEQLFTEANGDGQPYYQIWCVEDRCRVLPPSKEKPSKEKPSEEK